MVLFLGVSNQSVIPYLLESLKFGVVGKLQLGGLLLFWEFGSKFEHFLVDQLDVDDFLKFKQLLQLDEFLSGLA